MKCFPFLLRRFQSDHLQSYLNEIGQSQVLECQGGYFKDPENDHRLGHIDIAHYFSGKEGPEYQCPLAAAAASNSEESWEPIIYWHSDFRHFMLCDRCAQRLKGSPSCDIGRLYINYKVVVKEHEM